MPLYEYECDACGHRFEVIQKFSDSPIETCPSCGSKVHKLQSAPAFQFKGSGWYVTDYAKTGSGAESKASKEGRQADKDAAGKAESQAEGKTERQESSSSPDSNSSSEKTTSSAASSTPSTGSTGTSTVGSAGATGASKSGTTKTGD
jgi:putative FmdB family regulatory protein